MGNLIHTFNEDPTKVLIEKIPTGMMYDMCEYIKNNQTSLNCVTNADGEDIILDLAASKAGYVRRTSAIEQYKALWKDSVFMNGAKEGELHCSQSDYDLLTIWKERIRRSPASRFLDNSYEKEKEFYVRYGDVELKSKMDASKCVKRDSIHEIADWKSCVSLSDFKQNFFKYGYHIQDALYRLVFSVANDVPLHAVNFYFVALSKTPPYPVQVFKSSEIYDIEALLKRLMKHIQTNQWEFTLEENEYGYSKL